MTGAPRWVGGDPVVGWSVHYRCTPGTWLVVREPCSAEGWLFVSGFDAARVARVCGPAGQPPARALAIMATA